MINHTAITQRFKKYEPSLKASLDRGINYAITEGAAVLGGAPVEFSGGFAYTLWAADFNLLAMSRGVSRVANLAGRPGARRVFWSPDESGGEASPGPHARAPFPAAIFVADFLGKEGTPAVKELDTKSDLMGAYAMYGGENGNLQRVAIVNMRLYNGTTDRERGEDTFKVEVGDEVGSVRVQRLRADKGVAAMGFDFGGAESNVSWAGEQWSFKVNEGKGHFLGDRKEEERVEVKDGIASVVVPDSEAVIVFVE
ncbi:hypothetical protein IMZ48_28155 [Candidatus Bathyarchaeota archaeon]|nr:hypothetical protein [Candidatus Bathyarchaeota archaeon]